MKAMQGSFERAGHARHHPEGERSIRDAVSHPERASALQDPIGEGNSKRRAEPAADGDSFVVQNQANETSVFTSSRNQESQRGCAYHPI
jgi:hypothetical protein